MKILVSDKIAARGIEFLKTGGQVDTYRDLNREELLLIIPEYDALIVRGDTVVDEEVVAAGINLKVIGRAGLEVDLIDIQAATKRGIMVLNAPQGTSTSGIEYTLGMLLALSRSIPQAYGHVRSGKWERLSFQGAELREKVLGVLGFGRIGTGVAKRAKAFEMKVIAYDPFLSEKRGRDAGVELVELPNLLRQADYITLHLPLSVDTRHILNREAFQVMKNGAKIINCARGGLIDEEALCEALREGKVAGAALDVFENEPLPVDHPFVTMEQVICTPRLASRTRESENEVAMVVAKGVLAALRAEPVATSLNIPPVSRSVMETIKPYLYLVEKMGLLAAQLINGSIKNVEIQYNGAISEIDTKMLTLAALKGSLNPLTREEVNFVNAPEVARARGIHLLEVKSLDTENFVDLVTVKLVSGLESCEVAGTLLGEREGRIVTINGGRVDVEPSGSLLWIPHKNMPGVVGKVGFVMGEKRININRMQLVTTGDKNVSVMIAAVDQDTECSVMQDIASIEGVYGVKKVNFDCS